MLTENVSPSALTRLAVLVAESAWAYLVVLLLMAGLGSIVPVSAEVVFAPYALSVLLSATLSAWLNLGRGLARRLAVPAGRRSRAHPGLWAASRTAGVAFPAVATLVYCGAAVLVAYGSAWWALFGTVPPTGFATVESGPRDASAGSGALGWFVVFGLALWLRGTSLARGDVAIPSPLVRFSWASILLLAAGFLASNGLEPERALPWLGAFLLFGAMAVLSHRVDQSSRERTQSGAWRWGAAGLAVGVLLLGIGAGFLAWTWLADPVRAIWDAVAGLVVPQVSRFLAWLSALGGRGQLPPVPPEPAPMPRAGEGGFFQLPDEIRTIGQWLFNASWIVMILYATFINLRRWLTGDAKQSKAPTGRESLQWTLGGFIARLLTSLLFLAGQRWPRVLGLLRVRAPGSRSETVRELYRSLLSWSRRRGLPMADWMTPGEHLSAISSRWPWLEEDFALLTEIYISVRYGNARPEDASLEAGVAALQRITSEPSRTRRARPG